MQKSKIETFLGFCIKAKKISLGFNSAETIKKDAYLILLCNSSSENAKKQAFKLKEKLNCELMICYNLLLQDVVLKENCKLAVIRDKNLAQAIIKAEDVNFKIYRGGNI